jgi:hypothetical protein
MWFNVNAVELIYEFMRSLWCTSVRVYPWRLSTSHGLIGSFGLFSTFLYKNELLNYQTFKSTILGAFQSLPWNLFLHSCLLAEVKCLPFIPLNLGVLTPLEHSLHSIKCQNDFFLEIASTAREVDHEPGKILSLMKYVVYCYALRWYIQCHNLAWILHANNASPLARCWVSFIPASEYPARILDISFEVEECQTCKHICSEKNAKTYYCPFQ